jgi:glucosamine kinase
VFELAANSDPVSTAIVAAAADALTSLATRVGGALAIDGPVVLAGGLAVHQQALQEEVRDRLAVHGMNDVRVLDREPVYGAVDLAQALLGQATDLCQKAGHRP